MHRIAKWYLDDPLRYSEECAALQQRYPDMHSKQEGGNIVFVGWLHFTASFGDEVIQDCYRAKVRLEADYPRLPPVAYEIGNRIQRTHDNHVYPSGRLCLETETEIIRRFAMNPSVVGFIDDLVVPFLFWHSYREKHGKLPFPDRAHGPLGLIHYYMESLCAQDVGELYKLLKYFKDHPYRGHVQCPCDSGTKLRECHGRLLQPFFAYDQGAMFRNEAMIVTSYIEKARESVLHPHHKALATNSVI